MEHDGRTDNILLSYRYYRYIDIDYNLLVATIGQIIPPISALMSPIGVPAVLRAPVYAHRQACPPNCAACLSCTYTGRGRLSGPRL